MSDEKFTWTSPDGVTITLPSMNRIKAGVIRRNRKLDPVDAAFSVIEEVADPTEIEKLDELDTEELNACFEAWQAGVSVGESSGSST